MLEAAVADAFADDGGHIAITGASGWIGLATLDLLYRVLGDGIGERVSCYGSSTRALDLGDGRIIQQNPLTDLPNLRTAKARVWILHLAYLGKDRAETMDVAAYRAANQAISDVVLNSLDRTGAEGIFFASSGAATKADDPAVSQAMRVYGQMKRDDEARFAAWAQAQNRRAVIARVFNISGPYINKHRAYALASFILDALAQRPIAVRAPLPVIRSYAAIREIMSLVLALLATGDVAEVTQFDTGGEELELGEFAEIVSDTLGGAGVERAPLTESGVDRYVGNGAAYAALLLRHGISDVTLNQQIKETARHIAAHPARALARCSFPL